MNNKFIRVIPRLDKKNGMLIKGINLEGLRVLGDPYEFANYYYKNVADEICYVDNVATLYGTNNLSKFVSRTAQNLFIPLSVGGGIRSLKDIERMLLNGADKVIINSAAINDKNFIYEAAKTFGSSTITVTIESVKIKNNYFISKSNGRDLVEKDPVKWAEFLEDNGAGEIFLTSVTNEGLKLGYDINITKKISKCVNIPVIAHGGAGSFDDVFKVISQTNISGVSMSGLLHYNSIHNIKKVAENFKIGNYEFIKAAKKIKHKKKKTHTLKDLKKYLKLKGINVRI